MMFRLRKSVLLALVSFFSCIIVSTANTCQVSVDQTSSSSWNQNGDVFTLVNVGIRNSGSSVVNAVTLNIGGNDFDSFWEMVPSSNGWVLPAWREHDGIKVGESHSWGYILKSSSQAPITVRNVECDVSSSQPTEHATNPPTQRPTQRPTQEPTERPTQRPTQEPTERPTQRPTNRPTEEPTERPTERPTQRPTQRPTEEPTERPTQRPTSRPTSRPTQRPTEEPTERPTQRPTQRPTDKPTERPTQRPTEKPTEKPTQRPTEKPTAAPTQKPTSAPTSRPTNPPSSNGRLCPADQIWSPVPGTTWQWQLTGNIDTSFDVQMYDIDLFDASESVISTLHSKGRAVVCYFSTQYEDWRPDAKDFTSAVLGSNLDDWEGERYVDIRSTVVRNIMKARLDLAKSKGCDGVEPDNVDSYSNSNGLGLKAADQIDFNKFMAQEAHNRGLSVGLKNDLDQVKSLEPYYDWALNEQCNEYGECSYLDPFVDAGKAVFGVEYKGSASSFCPKMVSSEFSWLLKGLDLNAKINAQCCTYANGGCATKPAYTCKAPTNARSLPAEEIAANEAEAIAVAEINFEEQHSAGSIVYPAAFVAAIALALLF